MQAPIKKINIIFNVNFFYGFIFKVLNIISIEPKKYEHALYEKMPKFEQDNQKKLLNGHSSTLEFFLVKHT